MSSVFILDNEEQMILEQAKKLDQIINQNKNGKVLKKLYQNRLLKGMSKIKKNTKDIVSKINTEKFGC